MLFASVALLAAAALACGANARQVSLPIIVNGTTQLGHHTTVGAFFLCYCECASNRNTAKLSWGLPLG